MGKQFFGFHYFDKIY